MPAVQVSALQGESASAPHASMADEIMRKHAAGRMATAEAQDTGRESPKPELEQTVKQFLEVTTFAELWEQTAFDGNRDLS